jgi:hypothetical protein
MVEQVSRSCNPAPSRSITTGIFLKDCLASRSGISFRRRKAGTDGTLRRDSEAGIPLARHIDRAGKPQPAAFNARGRLTATFRMGNNAARSDHISSRSRPRIEADMSTSPSDTAPDARNG